MATHLSFSGSIKSPLCGLDGYEVDKPVGDDTCEACRVEASKIRAVLR